jgi:cysteinyl-tRNA synthetase
MGETSYNEFTIKELTKQLKLQDVKLNVIPIGFMQGYDFEENRVENEYMHMNQLTNAQLLMDMKEDAQDNMQIFPDQIAVSLYRRFRKRDVNPVALFRGNLEISQDLVIPV